jgi:hypothetical protein
MPLPEDWRAFVESLNSNGVEYVIVGAVEALIRNRRLIGRAQDRADLEALGASEE